jgi:hypothetical protein
MPTDKALSNNKQPKLNDIIIKIGATISIPLLVVPYTSILLFIFGKDDYLALAYFWMGYCLFLPIGMFALFFQALRIIRIKNHPPNIFNGLTLGCSLTTLVVGIFTIYIFIIWFGAYVWLALQSQTPNLN